MEGQTEVDTWKRSKGKWKPLNRHMSTLLLLSLSFKDSIQDLIFLGQKEGVRLDDILKALLAPQVIKFLCPGVIEA